MLANRLRKNRKRLKAWLRRTGVSCYRVYDRDIPEIPLAIDWYEGRLHIAEYARHHTRTPQEQGQWLDGLVEAAAEVFAVSADLIWLKQRSPQKGLSQYERVDEAEAWAVVEEGGLKFKVNLSDYLDTGLFLDHRPAREWFREQAEGRRCLNLFAYTGAFTVYAADGGAQSTTSVDLSRNYLAWAGENLELNGHTARWGQGGVEGHTLVKADVRRWLAEARERQWTYDLIIVDPPTFSNSKQMKGVFDVRRDHTALLEDALALLSPGGVLWFSTNSRTFSLKPPMLDGDFAEPVDVTSASLPPDFQHTRIHRCWRFERHADSDRD